MFGITMSMLLPMSCSLQNEALVFLLCRLWHLLMCLGSCGTFFSFRSISVPSSSHDTHRCQAGSSHLHHVSVFAFPATFPAHTYICFYVHVIPPHVPVISMYRG
ncbi:hypothetical protein B0I74DRAFT_42025 [Yarrowia lipolytica]|nr:hypothetical protein B0I74DRAFT_42025 [Yarrowia lipolytica]